jgi:hypothetical protein
MKKLYHAGAENFLPPQYNNNEILSRKYIIANQAA